MKTYGECYEFFAEHVNDVLPLFADGWSRFPAGRTATEINNRLSVVIESYKNMGQRIPKYADYAETLTQIAETITARANG